MAHRLLRHHPALVLLWLAFELQLPLSHQQPISHYQLRVAHHNKHIYFPILISPITLVVGRLLLLQS
jgi:hypothetical protein